MLNKNTIVTGGFYENSIKIWNIRNGECSKALIGHKNSISYIENLG